MTMLTIPKNAEFEFNGLSGHEKFVDTSCALLNNITDQAMSHRYRYNKAMLMYMHASPFPKSYRVVEEAIAHADSTVGLIDGKTTSVSAANRLYTKWSNNGYSITYLLKKCKERRHSQFTRDCESLADEVIQAEYLQFQGASGHETYEIFLAEYEKISPEFERQNAKNNSITNEIIVLKPMGRSSFYSYISRLDRYEVDKVRMGVKAARKKHRCVQSSIVTNRPLERVEVDALQIDIALEIEMAVLKQPFEQRGKNRPTARAFLAKHYALNDFLGNSKVSSTTTIRWSK